LRYDTIADKREIHETPLSSRNVYQKPLRLLGRFTRLLAKLIRNKLRSQAKLPHESYI